MYKLCIIVLSMFLGAGCAPAAVVAERFSEHPATADDLRATWGEPCTVEMEGASATWTYCVVLNPEGHEEWATCSPDCEPAHRMRIVGGIIVDDMPAVAP